MEVGPRVPETVGALERQLREDVRRGQRMEDRKDRLLHAKTRLIGVDTDALNAQVEERQRMIGAELERNNFYDTMSNRHAQAITQQVCDQQMNVRRAAEEMANFRKLQAGEKKERDRAEYMHIMGPRDEGNVTMSNTFLKFGALDDNQQEREFQQKHQLRDWLSEQLNEKEAARRMEQEREAQRLELDAVVGQMVDAAENEGEMNRRRIKEEHARYNKEMAAQKTAKARYNAEKDLMLATMEIDNAVQSQFLNEDPATTRSLHPPTVSQPSRRVPYHFKGFSRNEKQAVIDMQRQQQVELQNERLKQQQDEQDYARQQEDMRREMLRQDRELQRVRAENLKTLQSEHVMQRQEKNEKYQYLDKVVYTNPVGADFFNRFGTSAR